MTQQLLTLGEFCTDLPEWYEASTRNEYWAGWTELLDRLPAKADELGYFDMRDLCDIAEWGGQPARRQAADAVRQHARSRETGRAIGNQATR